MGFLLQSMRRSYDENFSITRNCDAELALRVTATQLAKKRRHGGKHRKSLEQGSSILTGNQTDFFRWILANFLCFSTGASRKSSEKSRKISGRNTDSTKSPELLKTGSFQAKLFDLGNYMIINVLHVDNVILSMDILCHLLNMIYSITSISEHLYKVNTSCLNASLGPPQSIFAVNRPLHSEHLPTLNNEHDFWSHQQN